MEDRDPCICPVGVHGHCGHCLGFEPLRVWLLVSPWEAYKLGWGRDRAGREGAGHSVALPPPGTVSQNYIFMLATTDRTPRDDLLSQSMTICSHV